MYPYFKDRIGALDDTNIQVSSLQRSEVLVRYTAKQGMIRCTDLMRRLRLERYSERLFRLCVCAVQTYKYSSAYTHYC